MLFLSHDPRALNFKNDKLVEEDVMHVDGKNIFFGRRETLG